MFGLGSKTTDSNKADRIQARLNILAVLIQEDEASFNKAKSKSGDHDSYATATVASSLVEHRKEQKRLIDKMIVIDRQLGQSR